MIFNFDYFTNELYNIFTFVLERPFYIINIKYFEKNFDVCFNALQNKFINFLFRKMDNGIKINLRQISDKYPFR